MSNNKLLIKILMLKEAKRLLKEEKYIIELEKCNNSEGISFLVTDYDIKNDRNFYCKKYGKSVYETQATIFSNKQTAKKVLKKLNMKGKINSIN